MATLGVQIYTPLQSRHIRLLRLKGVQNATLDCELTHHEYNDCPSYTALSYTWEPRHPRRTIMVNGKALEIGDNLWQFLQTVKDDTTSLLWIDQICIDQNNTEERNHQVTFMSGIYNRATLVVIWLGLECEGSESAMDLIRFRWFARCTKHQHTRPLDVNSQYAESLLSNIDFVRGMDAEGNKNYIDVASKGLKELLQRRYWRRLWIVQEIMFARQILLRCGHSVVSWEELEAFYTWVSRSGPYHRCTESREHHPRYTHNLPLKVSQLIETKGLWSGIGATWRPPKENLMNVVETYGLFDCSDKLDRVYGLLGMMDIGDKVPVDYEKHPVEVFTDVVKLTYKERWDNATQFAKFSMDLWVRLFGFRHWGLETVIVATLDEVDMDGLENKRRVSDVLSELEDIWEDYRDFPHLGLDLFEVDLDGVDNKRRLDDVLSELEGLWNCGDGDGPTPFHPTRLEEHST